jgi:hypothetical protein
MLHRFKLLAGMIFMLPMQALPQDDDLPTDAETDLIGLFEFLGEFETVNGDWISPEDLVQDVYTELDEPVTRSVTVDNEND